QVNWSIKKDLLGRTGHIRKNISRRCRVPPGETLTGCSASHAVAITEYPVMPLRSGGFAIIFHFYDCQRMLFNRSARFVDFNSTDTNLVTLQT
ncbi:hypothetical protein, partial [Atlantibacter hermannii]|uniref:hypothetical protein n=1 Tax=Atlantibacter hermannii TaxID=565 RepID=UPI002FDAD3E7